MCKFKEFNYLVASEVWKETHLIFYFKLILCIYLTQSFLIVSCNQLLYLKNIRSNLIWPSRGEGYHRWGIRIKGLFTFIYFSHSLPDQIKPKYINL